MQHPFEITVLRGATGAVHVRCAHSAETNARQTRSELAFGAECSRALLMQIVWDYFLSWKEVVRKGGGDWNCSTLD